MPIGKERGSRWPCVEGGKKLPISDESLKDRSGEIVGSGDSLYDQLFRSPPKATQEVRS